MTVHLTCTTRQPCLPGSRVTCNAVFLLCRHEGVSFEEGQGISAGQHARCMASIRVLAGIAVAQRAPRQSLQRNPLAWVEGVWAPAGLAHSLIVRPMPA